MVPYTHANGFEKKISLTFQKKKMLLIVQRIIIKKIKICFTKFTSSSNRKIKNKFCPTRFGSYCLCFFFFGSALAFFFPFKKKLFVSKERHKTFFFLRGHRRVELFCSFKFQRKENTKVGSS